MNQRAYVELEEIVSGVSFRAYLPIGSDYADAVKAFRSIADQCEMYLNQLKKQSAPTETLEPELVTE